MNNKIDSYFYILCYMKIIINNKYFYINNKYY